MRVSKDPEVNGALPDDFRVKIRAEGGVERISMGSGDRSTVCPVGDASLRSYFKRPWAAPAAVLTAT